MTTKAAIQSVLDALHSEIDGNPSVKLVDGIDLVLNDSLLICGYRESYNSHIESQLTNYSDILSEINKVQNIPNTLKAFQDYWQACKQG